MDPSASRSWSVNTQAEMTSVMKSSETTVLSQLPVGKTAKVVSVTLEGTYGKRLRIMGFIAGTYVSVVRCAPLQDPREYELRGTRICLRNEEARHVQVIAI